MDRPTETRPTVCHLNLARGYRGGERQTELLIRALARTGWIQRLVARRAEPLARRLTGVEGLSVVPCRAGGFGAARSIGRPDLIHVHEGRSLRSAWANSLLTGTPYIVTRRVQKGPRPHWLNRHMYGQASRIVVLSRAIADSVAVLDPGFEVTVIPSATSGMVPDPAASAALRARWGGDFVVGHVGALDDSHKGQQQILTVARALAATHPGMRFVLVGSGPDEALLREASKDDPRLILVGQVDGVADYLGAFDVFLFPSRHEGLGSILLDVLDLGLPVVATRVGGIPEIIEDDVNGLLVAVEDIEGMRQALLALATDSSLRARLGEAGRRSAEAFSPERMAERYQALYRSILRKKGTETA